MLSEFDIIKKYFQTRAIGRPDVICGIGDDAAVIEPPEHTQLVMTTDTLVENVHFLKETLAEDLGHRALAVNLSDLAAMGAKPAWVLLSLTLPEIDEGWLENFSQMFCSLAAQHQCALVGGNLSKGPLSITVQATGLVPTGQALQRVGAKQGDLIYVTGELGAAQAGLRALKNHESSPLTKNFLRPTPQIEIGVALRNVATSCIDISDGLLADLQHILSASEVGAVLDLDKVPVCSAIELDDAVTAGDDYELCFTVSPTKTDRINFPASCIGKIVAEPGLRMLRNQKDYVIDNFGYQHF